MFEWAKTFKGSTEDMAKTWKGIVSMLQDKWFQFRDAVMKAGVFEVLKKGLSSFNDKLDEFVKEGKLDEWAKNTALAIMDFFSWIIEGIENVAVAFLAFRASLVKLQEDFKDFFKKTTLSKDAKSIEDQLGNLKTKLGEVIGLTPEVVPDKKTFQDYIDQISELQGKFGALKTKIQGYRQTVKDTELSTEGLTEKTNEFGETIANTVLPAAGDTSAAMDNLRYKTDELHWAIVGLSEQGMLMFQNMTYAFSAGVMDALDAFHRFGEEGGNVLAVFGEAITGFVSAALNALKRFTMELLVESAKAIFAKQAEALAGVIASVMKSVPFPLNLLLVGGAMAAVSALFSGLTPKKYEQGGFVPQETFAHLHPGEYVMSKAEVQRSVGTIGNMAMAGTGMVVNPTVNIYAQTLDQDTINRAGDAIYYAVERARRKYGE